MKKYKLSQLNRGRYALFCLLGIVLIVGFFTLIANIISLKQIPYGPLLFTGVSIAFLIAIIRISINLSLIPCEIQLSQEGLTYYKKDKLKIDLKWSDIKDYAFDNVMSKGTLTITDHSGQKYKIKQNVDKKEERQNFDAFHKDFLNSVKLLNQEKPEKIKEGKSLFQTAGMKIWAAFMILALGVFTYIIYNNGTEGKMLEIMRFIGFFMLAIPLLVQFYRKNFKSKSNTN